MKLEYFIISLFLLVLCMYFSAEYKEGFESQYRSKCSGNRSCDSCTSMNGCAWCSDAKACLPSDAVGSNSACSLQCNEPADIIRNNPLYQDQVPDKIPPPAVYMSGKLGYSPQTLMAEINNIRSNLNSHQRQSNGEVMGCAKDTTAAQATPIQLSSLPPDLMSIEFDYKMKKMTDMIYDMKKTLDTPNASMSGIKTSIKDLKKELEKIEKKTGDVESLKKLLEMQNREFGDLKRDVIGVGRKTDSHNMRFDELKKRLDVVDKNADKPNVSIAELKTLVGDLSSSLSTVKANQPTNWIQMSGALKQISSDGSLVCGVDANKKVLCKDATDKTSGFKPVNTTGSDDIVSVSVSNGKLYIINNNSRSFVTNSVVNPEWKSVNGQSLVQADMDGNTVCGISSIVDGSIYCTDSITTPNWKKIIYTATPPVKFKHVSVKGKKLYAVSTNNDLYYVENYQTPVWKKVKGNLSQVDLDTNRVCGVTPTNALFCSTAISNPEWLQIRGKSAWISVNNNELYGIHPGNDGIWYTKI